MAYIYCDKCDFSQDDFWRFYFKPRWKFWRFRSVFGYNPLACFLEDCVDYMRPRWIGFDVSFIENHQRWGYPIWFRRIHWLEDASQGLVLDGNSSGLVERSKHEVFSWSLILISSISNMKKIRRMHWWTEKAWKSDPKRNDCPKCGAGLRID